MRIAKPDHTERRGDRVLFIWGDLPFWTVVDRQAARFIEALVAGDPFGRALRKAAGREPDAALARDAAQVAASLKRAGVIGSRRLPLPRDRIESISVNVTNRCNLRCGFCYNVDRAEVQAELPTDEFIRALEPIRRLTAPGAPLAILGGEPLLRKETTLALARWGAARGFRPIVSTNGVLADGAFADAAAAVGLECQVSIDGPSAEAHEAGRGAGTFAKAMAGAEALIGSGVHTILSMVCHAGNWRAVPDYLRMARDLGAAEARFIPLKRIRSGTGLGAADLVGLIRLTVETIAREPDLAGLLGRDFVTILANTCRSCARRQSCGTASQTFLLDADGTVYPCISLAYPEFRAGSVLEADLARILKRASVLAAVRSSAGLPGRQDCASCCFRHWCMGVCRGETYEATGSLSARSATCAANRASIIETFWTLSKHPEIAGRYREHYRG